MEKPELITMHNRMRPVDTCVLVTVSGYEAAISLIQYWYTCRSVALYRDRGRDPR
ncbi:MAG: hypothetical protein ACYDBK_00725 [Thermoplasmataceae archaeon]